MTMVCHGVRSVKSRRDSLRMGGGPCLFPLQRRQLRLRNGAVGRGATYLKRYSDQKETTANTWIFLNLTDGRPRTWSGYGVS
jgi:hypothetical protein